VPFPVDRHYIELAETNLGRRLPPDYAGRLSAANGGEVALAGDTWLLFPVFDDSDRKRIARTCNHILHETQNAQHWSGFPPDALAIGSNGSGDLLVLLPDGESFSDVVHWWDHETGLLHRAAQSIVDL
jgi:hypothetical protein